MQKKILRETGILHAINIRGGAETNTVKNSYLLETEASTGPRLKVMGVIEANPEIRQCEIARKLKVALGGVNYAIKALVKSGIVKARNFGRSDSKLGCLYTLTSAGMKQNGKLAVAFLSQKLGQYEVLKLEIEILRLEVSGS